MSKIGFAPVKVRWLKTLEGVPVFSGIAQILQGKTAVLDPHEAARAIKAGLAEAAVDEAPKPATTRKGKEL